MEGTFPRVEDRAARIGNGQHIPRTLLLGGRAEVTCGQEGGPLGPRVGL